MMPWRHTYLPRTWRTLGVQNRRGSRSHRAVDEGGSPPPLLIKHVRVQIRREALCGVAQEFLRGGQRTTSGDQHRRSAVPQIVNAQMRESGTLGSSVERLADSRCANRTAGFIREHAIFVAPVGAKQQAFGVGLGAVLPYPPRSTTHPPAGDWNTT